ncbi:hypothetical protein GLAREA_08113 [Glarea lozoyensis ATCC 20868]|uniref:Uncharacterized protein n=1 Tax=Glarea lozoyensis (strain ATCC 20868 / MF5171) TaxID=1116229 RepID=S3CCJ4_GLAL2|nr:uncharacterized protein GLAREA_08113 [Glarea lozoyensis ATCC 20868]EPE24262.1 hypothetical protein GLAREA_08113 [Glarea lozoyensis ATCC 20868]
MSKHHLLWVNSRITNSSEFPEPKFLEWYDKEHIPDIFITKQVSSAVRYSNINPSDTHPYLVLYPVKDINFLGSKQYFDIPVTSEKYISGGKKCFDVAEFDTRWYEFVDDFQKQGTKSGPAKLVISAGLTPAEGTDEDFNAWYRDEHYRTLSECTGYVRTRRYKLKNAVNAKNLEKPREPQKYLALHEFDVDTLPQDELQKTAETEWAKKVMGSLQGSEVMVFRLEKELADMKANI